MSGPGIPETCGLVLASGQDFPSVGRDGDGGYRAMMPLKYAFDIARSDVPEACGLVLSAGEDISAVATDRNGGYKTFVPHEFPDRSPRHGVAQPGSLAAAGEESAIG